MDKSMSAVCDSQIYRGTAKYLQIQVMANKRMELARAPDSFAALAVRRT